MPRRTRIVPLSVGRYVTGKAQGCERRDKRSFRKWLRREGKKDLQERQREL